MVRSRTQATEFGIFSTSSPFVACAIFALYSNALKASHAHINVSLIGQASHEFCCHVVKNLSLLALFIFSIEMLQMCALILEHPVYIVTSQPNTLRPSSVTLKQGMWHVRTVIIAKLG
jgi:hypothetical protein